MLGDGLGWSWGLWDPKNKIRIGKKYHNLWKIIWPPPKKPTNYSSFFPGAMFKPERIVFSKGSMLVFVEVTLPDLKMAWHASPPGCKMRVWDSKPCADRNLWVVYCSKSLPQYDPRKNWTAGSPENKSLEKDLTIWKPLFAGEPC